MLTILSPCHLFFNISVSFRSEVLRQAIALWRSSRSSFLGETLWGPWVHVSLEKRSKSTAHQKWQENLLIASFQTMCHSKSVVYRRVLHQLHLHLLLHHLHHRIPYLMSTDTPKIQYQKEVEVRVESSGETRCMKPQKPKTKIKIGNRKKYEEIHRMNCLIGYRNSGKILVDESTSDKRRGDPLQRSADTSSSSHDSPMEPRTHVEPG